MPETASPGREMDTDTFDALEKGRRITVAACDQGGSLRREWQCLPAPLVAEQQFTYSCFGIG